MFMLEGIFSRAPGLPRMLVSVHIPKCGGISFEHVLRGIYGSRRLWLNYGGAAGRVRREMIPANTRCIHGHFPSDTFDGIFPDAVLVTWLRHPVERVVSNYYHFLRHPEPENPCWRALSERGLSLEAFAELEPMRNEAASFLAGKPLAAFAFVGVTERYPESLQAFGAAFGLPVPSTPPHENGNPDRSAGGYRLSEKTYEHILNLNLGDLNAYNQAVARLDLDLGRARERHLAA